MGDLIVDLEMKTISRGLANDQVSLHEFERISPRVIKAVLTQVESFSIFPLFISTRRLFFSLPLKQAK